MEPAAPSASSASAASPAGRRRAAPEAAELRVRRRTLETVLEQCQRALELMRDAEGEDGDPEEDEEGEGERERERDPEGEGERRAGGDWEGPPPSPTPEPSEADYETDELCNLLKSRVESPEFLEKLDNIQKSVYQHGAVDETISWDIVSAADIWDDKSMNVSDDSEDGYVLVKQEDIVDGIACFMAAYLLSLKETKELTPNQLQEALSKTFSTKKRKGKLQKAWAGTQVIYNVASWSATAIGIYQNPAILKAATAAFWTSCRVVSKFL
ncbi:hypothetical protein CFC21_084812 [Triticum aestivum]|uniref:MADS box interactor-like n=3 Tax=Triticum TaxID=4564 RepID=A0A9R1B3P6_TRITD|nr:uncharacterized protein LOC119318152 isoform X1 [Triticum dicoccoides]XP_044404642.1 uncharacterized protein LOC123128640 isoform X1 [Triticum aestivum]KAF7080800.1 hypothetical protein CFC21_084812 [Triticum aestivum]VAI50265.1 unnamed protein product [Triticum turgidum subsp. durum]